MAKEGWRCSRGERTSAQMADVAWESWDMDFSWAPLSPFCNRKLLKLSDSSFRKICGGPTMTTFTQCHTIASSLQCVWVALSRGNQRRQDLQRTVSLSQESG